MAVKIKYKGVSLPSKLVDEIDLVVKLTPKFVSRAGFVREAIDDKLKEYKERKTNLTKEQAILTREDEELLVVAAEDFWERYHHFEEEAVRKFLQTRVSTREWPLPKLDQAVEFVCSQSRKN